MSEPEARGPSRRQLLQVGVAIGALMACSSLSAMAETTDFLELSRQLTGDPDLDPEIGAVYHRALNSDPKLGPALQQLLDNGDARSETADQVKQAILRQWYLGIYREAGQAHTASFERALMWPALGFEQPRGTCIGPTGYWSEPPAH